MPFAAAARSAAVTRTGNTSRFRAAAGAFSIDAGAVGVPSYAPIGAFRIVPESFHP
jgi:2-methylaconitate cis-trans-isomerase PrpF